MLGKNATKQRVVCFRINSNSGILYTFTAKISFMKLQLKHYLCGFILVTQLLSYTQDTETSNETVTDSSTEQEPDKSAIDAKLKTASVFISSKKFQKAIDEYNGALELDPENAKVYMDRGGLNFLLQELDGALADYDKAVEIILKQVKDHTKKAKIKRVLEDQTGASIDSQIVNELKVDLSEAYFRRGNVKIFMDDMEGGCKDLTESMSLGYPSAQKTLKEFCGYEDKKEPTEVKKPVKATQQPPGKE